MSRHAKHLSLAPWPRRLAQLNAATLPLTLLMIFSVSTAQGQPMSPSQPLPNPDEPPVAYPNLQFPTLGGKQFWTDYLIQDDWRIQQNVYSGHYRLLDPSDSRRASGNYSHCAAQLPPPTETPEPRHVVILLHGLGRSRSSMNEIKAALEKQTDLVPVGFSYASTRGTLSDHARALDHVIRNLHDCEQISFVGHSLGNLVVRRYLDEYQPPATIKWGRMVMLGPPNRGAQVARKLKNQVLFNLVWGQSGKQLAKHWDETQEHLATPSMEFGILAGGAQSKVSNPLVSGPDDLVVAVSETRLPGATDFRHIKPYHTFMMKDAETIQLTLQFLETGAFTTPQQKQPITQENLESTR